MTSNAFMTSNYLRLFLWAALGVALFLNYEAWVADYPTAPTTGQTAHPGHTGAEGSGFGESVPHASSSTPAAARSSSAQSASSVAVAPAAAAPSTAATASLATAPTIRVQTDVLDVQLSLEGGTLVRAALLKYHPEKGETEPVVLESRASPASPQKLYLLESGLTGPDDAARPTHLAHFTSAATEYRLAPGADELKVPLTWTDGHGVTVTKTYRLRRASYEIDVDQSVNNGSDMPWAAATYAKILRYETPSHGSMFSYSADRSFHGPAIYDGNKYRTLNITKSEDQNLRVDVSGGWMAAPEHDFVSAVIPPADAPFRYTLGVQGNEFDLAMAGPTRTVAPDSTADFSFKLYVGPKLRSQLAATAPELGRVNDYGRLYFLAQPLFWLLEKFHAFFGNWGVSIIIVTVLLKLLFYPLSEASYRSMARMKALAPRIKSIQETFKDDKEKAGRAVMELYKREKVNPVAGCLPMIIQLPIFIAFYWVLLESVEMRQAPFFGWINDLSSRDPYFILPAIMAVAMFVQYKLNPAPPDPTQAKVMMIMPIAMSAMFAFFPAGLTLYYVVNTILSIAQQWNINRRIEASAGRQKA
ncbi:MAG: membrane protein insertase YidC [Steroidobacteraceae bacterium]